MRPPLTLGPGSYEAPTLELGPGELDWLDGEDERMAQKLQRLTARLRGSGREELP